MAKLTMRTVRTSLREVGVTIKHDTAWGEYVVRIKGSPKEEGYHTSDLADAYQTGHAMAQDDPRAKATVAVRTEWRRIRDHHSELDRAKREDEAMLGLPAGSVKA